MTQISEVHNIDCLTFMRTLPDKFFDLAIVDPPYGNNLSGGRSNKNGWNKNIDWDKCNEGWNKIIPNAMYFNELFRVSKNQIVWGGNYFCEYLPSSECWLIWDKGQRDFSLADGEMAWASFDKALRIKTIHRSVSNSETDRFHPTQKPVALYKWLLQNYAKQGDKIFDSHMGSQSSRIAAWHMGFDYWGCELDKDYFTDGCKRFEREKMKQELFAPKQIQQPKQLSII